MSTSVGDAATSAGAAAAAVFLTRAGELVGSVVHLRLQDHAGCISGPVPRTGTGQSDTSFQSSNQAGTRSIWRRRSCLMRPLCPGMISFPEGVVRLQDSPNPTPFSNYSCLPDFRNPLQQQQCRCRALGADYGDQAQSFACRLGAKLFGTAGLTGRIGTFVLQCVAKSGADCRRCSQSKIPVPLEYLHM